MKRLAALALVAVLAGCSVNMTTANGTKVHWQQTNATLRRDISVIVPAAYASNGLFMNAINSAIQQANRSPYMRLVLDVPQAAPSSCPDRHCIVVGRAPGINGATTVIGWTAAGHIYGRGATITFDSAPWAQNVLINAACHEIAGHALGLGHPASGVGPCYEGQYEGNDLPNIAAAHSQATPIYPPPAQARVATPAAPPVQSTQHHTYAEYVDMAS